MSIPNPFTTLLALFSPSPTTLGTPPPIHRLPLLLSLCSTSYTLFTNLGEQLHGIVPLVNGKLGETTMTPREKARAFARYLPSAGSSTVRSFLLSTFLLLLTSLLLPSTPTSALSPLSPVRGAPPKAPSIFSFFSSPPPSPPPALSSLLPASPSSPLTSLLALVTPRTLLLLGALLSISIIPITYGLGVFGIVAEILDYDRSELTTDKDGDDGGGGKKGKAGERGKRVEALLKEWEWCTWIRVGVMGCAWGCVVGALFGLGV